MCGGGADGLGSKSAKKRKDRALHRSEVKRWHSHGVGCLSFSPDGAYLYSGGEEAVFVVCQVGTGEGGTYLHPASSRCD